MEEFLEGLKTFDPGVPDPSEFICVFSPHNKGIKLTEDVKERISIGRKGIPSYRPGYSHSKETRGKIRETNMGRKHTKETCKKMSKSRMGHLTSKETRKKIADSLCKNTYLLKHISGKEVVVNNFTQFCRDNNLHRSRMMDRITGKVKKLYKGWTGQVMKSVL
jgi:hypothetical protein